MYQCPKCKHHSEDRIAFYQTLCLAFDFEGEALTVDPDDPTIYVSDVDALECANCGHEDTAIAFKVDTLAPMNP